MNKESRPGNIHCVLNGTTISGFTDHDLWLMAVAVNAQIAADCEFSAEERERLGSWITNIAYITFENLRTYINPHVLGGEMLLARGLLAKMVPEHPEIASAYEVALTDAIDFGHRELAKTKDR